MEFLKCYDVLLKWFTCVSFFVSGNLQCLSDKVLREFTGEICSYHPIPIVFSQAKGSCIWDPEGNRYLDFLAAYSAVNQV